MGEFICASPVMRIRVKILRALNLLAADANGESDPYVKVAVAPGITFISPEANKVEWKKTGVVSKNRNPVWTKDAEFSLDVKDPVHEKLWFQVFDKDLVGSDDPLGATCTSFHSLVQGQVESRCLKLSGRVSKNEGQLFVELEALDFQGPATFPPHRFPYDFRQSVVVGPLLSFRGQDVAQRRWRVSMLLVVQQGQEPVVLLHDQPRPATLVYQTRDGKLDFLAHDFTIPQTDKEQQISYQVAGTSFGFLVPAWGKTTRWAYWSCNGYQSVGAMTQLGGIQPMWRHLLQAGDLHMMYGGGDQLYMDGIIEADKSSGLAHEGLFSLPLLQEWMVKREQDRLHAPFTDEMASQVYQFAVKHYISQFTLSEFADALATIPSIMSWDDHDAWDGMGSYKHLNDSKVFQEMRPIMQELYLAFQHHTTRERAASDCDMFGHESYSTLHYIDNGATLLLSFDTRSERNAHQIIHKDTYEMGRNRLQKVPPQLQHLLVMLPVPLAYPDMFLVDTLFSAGDKLKFVDRILGAVPGVKNEFDYEMRDDFLDHWNHANHEFERDVLLAKIFELNRKWRVTLVSGDVHHMAVGKLKSKEHPKQPILNIISSAIGNIPPSAGEAKFLQTMAALNLKMNKDVSMQLEQKYDRLQYPLSTTKSVSKQIINRRNFTIWQQNVDTNEMAVHFYVEKTGHRDQFPTMYEVTISPY